ncbi:MAG: hypothetical protein IPH13_21215 [Planctomycetes bacterium]|nr:hypothetical protein [Planctomycetota bacterium]MCC7173325.1 hypothetical protein [Planctomycetota bacterium]
MSFLWGALVLWSTFAAVRADVEFVAGDPGVLVARIAKAKVATDKDYGALLDVEVENRGDDPAEPLVFELFEPGARGAADTILGRWSRVETPHFGRHGRTVAPRAKAVFPAIAMQAPALLKKAKVRVVRASFARGATAVPSPLSIVSRRAAREFDPDEKRDVDVTFVRVKNTLDRPLDAVFLVRFGKKGLGLARGRVEASTTTEVRLRGARHSDGREFAAGEPTDVDVVDWSIDAGAESSAQPLQDAVRAMSGVDAAAELTATVEIRVKGKTPFVARGAMRAAPKPAFTPEGSLATESAQLATRSIQSALAFVRAGQDRERTLGDARVVANDLCVVYAVPDFAWSGMKNGHVALRDGKLAWWSFSADTFGPWNEIVTSTSPRGDVITGVIEHATYQVEPQSVGRWTYADPAIAPLPTTYVRAERATTLGIATDITLTFSDWRIDGQPAQDVLVAAAPAGPREEAETKTAQPAPPAGPQVDALRAVWSEPYAIPVGATIAGDYVLENPGTDALWKGVRKLSGTFRVVGTKPRGWNSWTVTVTDPKVSREDEAELAQVVEDRLRMFIWRDPAFREPFDVAFAGATIEATADGFAATGGTIASLTVADGRPSVVRSADGHEGRWTWTRVDGQWLVQESSAGKEVMRWTWAFPAAGVAWPKSVEMRDVFENWGPETLRFTRVTAQR